MDNQENERYDLEYIPINANYDLNIGHYTFEFRRLAEGCIIGAILFIVALLGLKYLQIKNTYRFTISFCLFAGGVFLGIKGINGDSITQYFLNVLRFNKNKRITYYNPRVKKEIKFYAEQNEDDEYVLPRERIEALYRKVMTQKDSKEAEKNLKDEEETKIFFQDDIDYLGKPKDLMSKRELKKLEKQKIRAEKQKQKLENKKLKKEGRLK